MLMLTMLTMMMPRPLFLVTRRSSHQNDYDDNDDSDDGDDDDEGDDDDDYDDLCSL